MSQLGFRKGSSTELQLTRTLMGIKEKLKKGPVYAISFDIVGAFDHVPHITLMKLIRYILKTHQND